MKYPSWLHEGYSLSKKVFGIRKECDMINTEADGL